MSTANRHIIRNQVVPISSSSSSSSCLDFFGAEDSGTSSNNEREKPCMHSKYYYHQLQNFTVQARLHAVTIYFTLLLEVVDINVHKNNNEMVVLQVRMCGRYYFKKIRIQFMISFISDFILKFVYVESQKKITARTSSILRHHLAYCKLEMKYIINNKCIT